MDCSGPRGYFRLVLGGERADRLFVRMEAVKFRCAASISPLRVGLTPSLFSVSFSMPSLVSTFQAVLPTTSLTPSFHSHFWCAPPRTDQLRDTPGTNLAPSQVLAPSFSPSFACLRISPPCKVTILSKLHGVAAARHPCPWDPIGSKAIRDVSQHIIIMLRSERGSEDHSPLASQPGPACGVKPCR